MNLVPVLDQGAHSAATNMTFITFGPANGRDSTSSLAGTSASSDVGSLVTSVSFLSSSLCLLTVGSRVSSSTASTAILDSFLAVWRLLRKPSVVSTILYKVKVIIISGSLVLYFYHLRLMYPKHIGDI